ncbi:hypothetical protein [Allorhizocola rhizosphaerae]|uniref:hypothetical protein n=1 Tax=Allorhizocola rhizosphaerae TaxID=1872709 RepID=UPI0013C36B6D|nr:hypothetical protein [Allorhizocola rhizosphaerae]
MAAWTSYLSENEAFRLSSTWQYGVLHQADAAHFEFGASRITDATDSRRFWLRPGLAVVRRVCVGAGIEDKSKDEDADNRKDGSECEGQPPGVSA